MKIAAVCMLLCLAPVSLPALEFSASTTTAATVDVASISLFSDHKCRKVGDLVTVIVMESAQASKKVSSKANKKSGTTMDISATDLDEELKMDHNTKYAGDSSTERRGTLTARITATVTAVLPNGNMVISGSQDIKISDDRQKLFVTGTVRPEDISANNTVLSTKLADAKIEYTGKESRSRWIHWLGPVGWFYNWLF